MIQIIRRHWTHQFAIVAIIVSHTHSPVGCMLIFYKYTSIRECSHLFYRSNFMRCSCALCSTNIKCILFIDITYFVHMLYISVIPDALLCGVVVYKRMKCPQWTLKETKTKRFMEKAGCFCGCFFIYEQNGRTLLWHSINKKRAFHQAASFDFIIKDSTWKKIIF